MINLSDYKKIYFIGIKGVAMSALAVICKQKGLEVAGSDVEEKFITDKILAKNEIKVFEGFSVDNLAWQPDLVVVGASWSKDHIEVKEVDSRKLLHITDSQLRGVLSNEKNTIAVTGVHGKTTTTALLSYIFKVAGKKPSYLIGTGNIPDLGSNAIWDEGQNFIVEGDEYIKSQEDRIPKFLDLNPATTIITSLEWEHVDVFENLQIMEQFFSMLIEKTNDLVIACGDWPSIEKIIQEHQGKKIETYGFSDNNIWQASNIKQENGKTYFDIKRDGQTFGQFHTKLFGRHNVLNSLASIIVCVNYGINLEVAQRGLDSFQGAERRFDIDQKNNIIFVDDYAHHPTEIRTTLEAIADKFPDKEIWCVFQPHMVSRTKALFSDFVTSFSKADRLIMADIFASARESAGDITSSDLIDEIKKYHAKAEYGGSLESIYDKLVGEVKPGVVIVTMGAGNVYEVRDKFLNKK